MEKITSETQFSRKMSWPVRISYAGGDVAFNIIFGLIGTLLTIFYTDYIGISVGIVGIIILISRIFDAVGSLIMGFVVEKTKSKFGKARPWLLWMSVPFCISTVLLFTVPGNKSEGDAWYRILYIILTYNFATTICYTAINVPYITLPTFMTPDSHERDVLGNIRMGLSPLGKVISVVATLPLVQLLGKDQSAWVKVMSIYAVIAFILIIINFLLCKENPELNHQNEKIKEEDKLPVKTAIKFLLRNKYFWLVLALWLFQSASFGVVGTILPYHCKWVLEDNKTLYSTLFLIESVVLVGGVFICLPLMNKVGKRNLALIGSAIALIGQIVYAFQPYNMSFLIMSCVVRSIGFAPLNAVVIGMLGDVVDYGHWKNGFRQESLICAGGSFAYKLGTGLSSVIVTALLALAGYDSLKDFDIGEKQSESAKLMITHIYIIAPIVIAAGVFLVLIFYDLDKNFDTMMDQLFDRLMIEKMEDKLKEEREAKKEAGTYDEKEEAKVKPLVESKEIKKEENKIDSKTIKKINKPIKSDSKSREIKMKSKIKSNKKENKIKNKNKKIKSKK